MPWGSSVGWALPLGCALTAAAPWKGLITLLVGEAVSSPDQVGGERLGGVPKHTHFVLQYGLFLPTLVFGLTAAARDLNRWLGAC